MRPQAEQEAKFVRKFSWEEESWRIGMVNLAVFSLCIKDDD